jgi:hypothetical protein
MHRKRFAPIILPLLSVPLLAAAAANFPAQVTAPQIQMTGGIVSTPTPAPEAQLPGTVTAGQLVMIGALPTATPTPPPPGHLPATVQATPIQMTGIGGP